MQDCFCCYLTKKNCLFPIKLKPINIFRHRKSNDPLGNTNYHSLYMESKAKSMRVRETKDLKLKCYGIVEDNDILGTTQLRRTRLNDRYL